MGSARWSSDLNKSLQIWLVVGFRFSKMAGVERKAFDKSKFEGKPIIWIMGGPGSGKGTQCEKIAVKFGYCHLSSGDLLRNEVMSGSKRGQQIYMLMANGNTVPSEIVTDLLGEAMEAKASSSRNFQGFLIDGFPIHLGQAEIFVSNLGKPTRVICLDVSDEVMTGRLLGRGNFDDPPDAIQKRIANYNENTRAIMDKFPALGVNAEVAPDEIASEVAILLPLDSLVP